MTRPKRGEPRLEDEVRTGGTVSVLAVSHWEHSACMSRTKSNEGLSSAWGEAVAIATSTVARGMTAGAVGTAVHSSVMWLGRSMRRFAQPPELIIDSVLSSEREQNGSRS